MLREVIELSSDEICQKLELSVSHLNVLMYRKSGKAQRMFGK